MLVRFLILIITDRSRSSVWSREITIVTITMTTKARANLKLKVLIVVDIFESFSIK